MTEPRVLPTRDGYDRWATTYDDDASSNWVKALDQIEVERTLDDLAGRDLLDVGGGTGRHAIRLARSGARVTVIDFSEGMIAKARAKLGNEEIQFVFHDVLRPFPFADRSFDYVLSALLLEHIPVPDLEAFFRELCRVTRDDGSILVTAMHPARFLRGRSANFRDSSGEEVRPRSYEASLSDYVMGALRGGLEIRVLAERVVDGELVERFPRAAQSLGWPALFVMTLTPRRP
jgi:ubiquinone/menaquinone biosynthesis C-methylase UbiE